jgi:hypothetical protein
MNRIRIGSNGHYFTDQTGKPFFYLGDTAWLLFHRKSKLNGMIPSREPGSLLGSSPTGAFENLLPRLQATKTIGCWSWKMQGKAIRRIGRNCNDE